MHLIATYLLLLTDYALRTSEKVPSPFLLISLYSLQITLKMNDKRKLTVHFY